MAESGAEKSRGLRFAERQLLRHGWEHGKGLGRDENGISEAIKVKVKCDKSGIGHKEGDQFTFHWWDHVFNQTSASLQVESDHSGTKLHKSGSESEGAISNKKPLNAKLAKDKLYGGFVKSATLLSGLEQATRTASSDSSSSSDDEDDAKLDLSSTTKMSDVELVRACGGRTAHKGARHGLKMSAKLARLEQQEAEFMAKYGKKTQTPEQPSGESEENANNAEKRTKKKKKRKASEPSCLEPQESAGAEEVTVKRKKKKKKRDAVEEELQVQGDNDAQENPPPPLKKKKKKSKE
ncbi:G patch domain-containing protein 4 [Boleophthalmus pectinirostris]|uniref:G patch domain-containing protein 4 n=1 Tax=Boleophthalmus pectinirostris TaxID=150288 RepID=UPI000A1C3AEB|nr:G patch domain-containing protein 4 [Boleophthalmus pectinirostris]